MKNTIKVINKDDHLEVNIINELDIFVECFGIKNKNKKKQKTKKQNKIYNISFTQFPPELSSYLNFGDNEIEYIGSKYKFNFINKLLNEVILYNKINKDIREFLNVLSPYLTKKELLQIQIIDSIVEPRNKMYFPVSTDENFSILPDQDNILFGTYRTDKNIIFEIFDEILELICLNKHDIIGEIFINRMRDNIGSQKICVSLDFLISCISNHHVCNTCKTNRTNIRDLYKGTVMELFVSEKTACYLKDFGNEISSKFRFLYDFNILAGNIDNKLYGFPHKTNVFIKNNMNIFFYKNNLFIIDILVHNYGINFMLEYKDLFNKPSNSSDKFITLLLIENNFSPEIVSTLISEFNFDIDFILNMFSTKINLLDDTFSNNKIESIIPVLFDILNFLYKKNKTKYLKHDFIKKICEIFDNSIYSNCVWKYKVLDIVIFIQEGEDTKLIPIIYEKPPEKYYLGMYLDKKKTDIKFDIKLNNSFIFTKCRDRLEEKNNIITISEEIRTDKHLYTKLESSDYLEEYYPKISPILFHIMCEEK